LRWRPVLAAVVKDHRFVIIDHRLDEPCPFVLTAASPGHDPAAREYPAGISACRTKPLRQRAMGGDILHLQGSGIEMKASRRHALR